MKTAYGSAIDSDLGFPFQPILEAATQDTETTEFLETDERDQRLRELQQELPFLPAKADDVLLLIPTCVPITTLLHRLVAVAPRHRADLQGSANAVGGSGGQFGRLAEIGGRFLKTCLDRSYDHLGTEAHKELERERLRRRLRIYPPERLWFLSRGKDDRIWACSLTPTLPTLRQAFNRQIQESQEAGDSCWRLFLRSLRWTLSILEKHDVVLDCNPNNFGITPDRLFYLDDDLLDPCGQVPWVTQALLRLREYPQAPMPHRRFFVKSVCELLEELPKARREQWGLLDDLDQPALWPQETELAHRLNETLCRLRYTRRSGAGKGKR